MLLLITPLPALKSKHYNRESSNPDKSVRVNECSLH